jgi:hypothetical protein
LRRDAVPVDTAATTTEETTVSTSDQWWAALNGSLASGVPSLDAVQAADVAEWIIAHAGLVQNAIAENRERGRKFVIPAVLQSDGYLQEVNRRFFHPLGMALAVTSYPDGAQVISGVIDARDDPEGYVFDLSSWPDPAMARRDFHEKAVVIENEWDLRSAVREERFGWVVQPPTGELPEAPVDAGEVDEQILDSPLGGGR